MGRLNYYLNLGANEVLVNPVYYASERNTDGGDTYQTTQIQREEIGDRGYAYTYDNVGNIKTITEKKNSTSGYTAKVSYDYDDLGQLIRENNVDLNQTIVYTYDNGGNIKSKKIYAYTTATDPGTPTQTISYTYDSTWKDKLTNYNGTTITYDAIGNPLTYHNGMSFTWNGRQMATANLNGTAVTYKYDADGLRNYKKVGNTVHEYEYVGGQLVYEKRGDLKFYYRYNAMGELASIKRVNSSGTEYTVYVVTNTRGDVEELWLASGTMVARYVYDTWGNTIGILNASGNQITDTSNIGVQNPFRYRSYYYDDETGLYYVSSRYYDPEIGRFISSDISDVLTATPMALTDKNLYAYCDNNPVNRTDSDGDFWHIVAGAAIGGMLELGSQLLSGEKVNWAKVGVATLAGGVTSAVGPLLGAAISGITNATLDAMSGEKNIKKLAVSGMTGASASLVGFGVGKAVEKIGSKIATKTLSKMSKTKLKTTVTKLVPTIKGSERNMIKNFSQLTKNYPTIGTQYFMSSHLGKTLVTSTGQMAEGVTGGLVKYFGGRCFPS